MFFGEYNHNVDDKGRMSIPSRFREELGDQFFITKGLDDCLFVFPAEEWKAFVDKLKQLPLSNKQARKFSRFFYSGAIECNLDKQGRVNIGSHLREYAKIEKEVCVIGVGTRLEIWNKSIWDSDNDAESLNYDDIATQMEALGI